MAAPETDTTLDPIVIYRSVNGNGQTLGLAPLQENEIRQRCGAMARFHPRVTIAHECKADYESLREALLAPILQILTGVPPERQHELGGVRILDPVTEEEVPRRQS